jgi:hypothetical protein
VCNKNDDHPHASQKRWYGTMEEELKREKKQGGAWRVDPDNPPYGGRSGWYQFSRSQGARLLLGGHLVRWFRWVFTDLDHHAPGCRWARVARALVPG